MTDSTSVLAHRCHIVPALALAALMAVAGCGGGSSGTGSTGATPTPTPPAAAFTVNGTAKTPVAIDTLTTRSGHWRFSDLGAVGADSQAYLWRLDENADFVRVMICRRAFTAERNDPTTLDLQTATVAINDRGHSYNWSLSIAPGACRVMQNMEPVAPHPEWLREAVATRRVPAYTRERAYLSGLPALALNPQQGAYDPTSLGNSPGSTTTPTANSNFVGVTSGQGGEYEASRGFLHNADARVIDAALHNEDSAITTFMPEFVQYTYYSLAQPNAAEWSMTNQVTVDPQFPQSGDKAYEYPNATVHPRTDIDTFNAIDGWGRDESHLENTGYVHWILTEDPIAGMVVQRQLAFHLANYFEYQRPNPQTAYTIQVEQERGIYNGLAALWKSRDVARRVTSINGKVLWDTARVDRMVSEGIASIDTQTRAFGARDLANITGAVLRDIYVATWDTRTGGTATYAGESNFEGLQYGKEPLWLWTRDGNDTVKRWFIAKARQAVVRTVYIGGALGLDRAEDQRGSTLPLGPGSVDANGLGVIQNIFANDVEWGAWVKALPIAVQSTTSYDQASVHTAEQMQGMLLFAKDAALPVADLDTAISKAAAAKAATTAFRFTDLQMHKHLGGPPS